MRTLVATCHADDESLWCFDFIVRHPGVHVALCTIDRRPGKELRIERFYRACGAMGAIPFVLAGNADVWGIDVKPILAFARDYDLIVTHNERGEYGHPAHIALHHAMRGRQKPMKVFGHGLVRGEPIDYEAKCAVLDIYEDPALIPWLTKRGMDLKCETLLDL